MDFAIGDSVSVLDIENDSGFLNDGRAVRSLPSTGEVVEVAEYGPTVAPEDRTRFEPSPHYLVRLGDAAVWFAQARLVAA